MPPMNSPITTKGSERLKEMSPASSGKKRSMSCVYAANSTSAASAADPMA
jgi:hypothetical protein